MSRPLNVWIKAKKRRQLVRRKVQALFAYLMAETPRAWREEPEYQDAIHFLAWRIDMECYRRFGHSLTGASWVKMDTRPVPFYPPI